jgi:hypothetical protein
MYQILRNIFLKLRKHILLLRRVNLSGRVHELAGIFYMPWSLSLADNHDIISLLVKAVTPPASGDDPLKPDEVRVAACQFVSWIALC